jgi:hypothetical protein
MSDRDVSNINDKSNSHKQQSENVMAQLGGELLSKPEVPVAPNNPKLDQVHGSENFDNKQQVLEKADQPVQVGDSAKEKDMTAKVMENASKSWADKAAILKDTGWLNTESIKDLAKMFPYAAETDAFKNAFQVKK